jgi:crotonobetainyl-CoA:carnitine CoA-transferase CaiB-like acyl-CoA transferase
VSALAGIRVLEFTHFLAGPYTGLILADLGADVIKLEDPSHPDEVRDLAPLDAAGQSLYFQSLNWGKRSVGLGLTDPRSAPVLRDLVGSVDVVVDNFRPRVLAKLNLSHEQLVELNPRIITCSVTGFGETGPYAQWPGYDYTIQAQAGVMGLAGEPDGPPTKAGISYLDHSGGLAAALAVCAALVERARTGVGRHIDLGLIDVQTSMLTYLAAWNLNAGVQPTRHANSAHPSLVPAQNFATADGYVSLFVGNDGMWARLVEVVDDEVLRDPRFVTQAGRSAHRTVVLERLGQLLLTDTAAAWTNRFSSAGVACGAVNDLTSALADPHLAARGLVAGDDSFRHVRGPVLSLSDASSRPAPTLGANNADVLGELGYAPDKVAALEADGILGRK